MNVFVISKNRACQLDALIRSLAEFGKGWANPRMPKLHVLCLGTTQEFRNGYETVFKDACNEWGGPVTFTPELNNWGFRNNLISVMKTLSGPTLFLTDDCLFHAPITASLKSVEAAISGESFLFFSLRLGKNTTIQNPANSAPMFPALRWDRHLYGLPWWDWTTYPMSQNWGYPISMDGVVYDAELLTYLTKRTAFDSLRSWEGNLVTDVVRNYKELGLSPYGLCQPTSAAVNIPANVVQNRGVEVAPHEQSETELNEKFLAGHRIDLTKTLAGVKIQGSHQYITLQF